MVSELVDPFGKKKVKKINKVKRKKLLKLSREGDIKELVSDRFTEHSDLFTFFDEFSQYSKAFSPDINNILIWSFI